MNDQNHPTQSSSLEQVRRRIKAGYNLYQRLDSGSKISFWIIIAITGIAILAPLFSPYDPFQENYDQSLTGPSLSHPAGTDLYGRDLLTRLIYGARVSLAVGVGAVVFGAVIGVPIGAIGGYFGGWTDEFAMRTMDILISFPALVLALAIIGSVGASLLNLILIIGLVFSPQYARIVHGEVLSIKEEEYVEAAESTGLGDLSIIKNHILPNAMTPVIVQATFHVALAIIIEASLSFLGLGVQPPNPTWGVMIAEGREFLPNEWWMSVFPGIAILITVLAFNLLGDGLRDEYDPRSMTEQ